MSPSSPSASEIVASGDARARSADAAVRVTASGLTKTFPIDRQRQTVFQLVRQVLSGRWRHDRFVAVADLTFAVRRGERVGLIGDNGAGKSTLLRTLAGLHRPDRGDVTVRGSITLVAGLAVGMVEELTVADNVSLYGAIYGIDRDTLRARQSDIIEWAGLTEFTHMKLKRLSSGMKSRLAFSACRYIEADLYLMDEALTAGDRHFQQKCEQVFHDYLATDKTLVVATHDLDFVTTFCTHAMWMHKGRLMAFGDPLSVVERYRHSREQPAS